MKKIFSVALACILLLLAGCGYSEAELQSQYEKGYDKGFLDGSSSEREKNLLEETTQEDNDLQFDAESASSSSEEETIVDKLMKSTGLQYLWEYDFPTTIQMQRETVGNTYLRDFYPYEYDLVDLGDHPYIVACDSSGNMYIVSISENDLSKCLATYETHYIVCEVYISSVISTINYYPEQEPADDIPEYMQKDDFWGYIHPYIDNGLIRTVFATCNKIHFFEY